MNTVWMKYLEIGLWIAAAVAILSHLIIVEYRSRKQSRKPLETARAVAYCKHPDMEPVLTGRHSSYNCYITFHTDSGDILKLYMTPQDYHSISEGSRGILTWQYERFWKFEKEE